MNEVEEGPSFIVALVVPMGDTGGTVIGRMCGGIE